METQNIDEELKKRLAELPRVVRDAISSADVEKKLRELSEGHKLHLDQWQILENEVMLALLGFLPLEELESHIKDQVGVSAEIANILTTEISASIFQPIREELERELDSPDAKEKKVGELDKVRTEVLADKPGASSQQPVADKPVASSQQPAASDLNPVSPSPATSYGLPATSSPLPSTPPPPPNTEKSIRAPISSAYASQSPSHERVATEGDPYREAI